jgi:hypothetical protein
MATAINAEPAPYPVRFDVAYPEQLSRWKIFVKWLLAIPHILIVDALNAVVRVMTLIALFAILFTKKYPPGLFEFAVGAARWRLNMQAYVFLDRDEYPPFSWDAGLYPVTFEVDYPEELNRWLPLVKWILALPHYIILILLFVAVAVTKIIAFFAILFTARYPRGLFDFAVGVDRWSERVQMYVFLLRDEYPPFRLRP